MSEDYWEGVDDTTYVYHPGHGGAQIRSISELEPASLREAKRAEIADTLAMIKAHLAVLRDATATNELQMRALYHLDACLYPKMAHGIDGWGIDVSERRAIQMVRNGAIPLLVRYMRTGTTEQAYIAEKVLRRVDEEATPKELVPSLAALAGAW